MENDDRIRINALDDKNRLVKEEERVPSLKQNHLRDKDEINGDNRSVPLYAKNFDGHLPLHWLVPKEEESNAALPSFRDLRLKTHRTLYGTDLFRPRDKSPKGSVDAPISHLVDLINSHSRFCTLSSCSGRISLFDPNGSTVGVNSNENENADTSANPQQFTEASGKGRGRWVLVSHDLVPPGALVEAIGMNDEPRSKEKCCNSHECQDISDNECDEIDPSALQQPWTFRLEPMLLHIAAASLEDGRKLLTIALNLGFRESGLVVTEKRVTVAIRSHSLATATPLLPAGTKSSSTEKACSSLRVPPSYLRALVHDANQRMEANWNHLDRLYRSIESTLFEVRSTPPPLVVRSQLSSTTNIDPLNLWNATSIGPSIQKQGMNSHEERNSVLVVGGYGCGPVTNATIALTKPKCAKRSNKAYQLKQNNTDGSWQGWKALDPPSRSSSNNGSDEEEGILEIPMKGDGLEKSTTINVHWNYRNFPDLQGMASCPWKESLTLLWGGRKSPSAPSDDLFILDRTNGNLRIGTIRDVRGEIPVPRWGHKLLALGDDRFVLLGGCNQPDGALDDIFVLHFCTKEKCNTDENEKYCTSRGYFYWERLLVQLPTSRFHFGAVVLQSDMILVMGGLESTRELLKPFDNEFVDSSSAVWAVKIGKSRIKNKATEMRTTATEMTVELCRQTSAGYFHSFFGMACCTLLSQNLLVITGGLQSGVKTSKASEPLQAYWISESKASILSLKKIELGYNLHMADSAEPSKYDFGSMVHHCCVPLSDNELLLVGGGVPSFAFGESYAKSHHLLIDTDNSLRSSQKSSNRKQNVVADNSTKPNIPNQVSRDSSRHGEAKEIANVVYVAPKNARQTKNSLQQKGWLEKRYRMVKVKLKEEEEAQVIALPISVPFAQVISDFGEMVLHHGQEELPLSTSQYASKPRQI